MITLNIEDSTMDIKNEVDKVIASDGVGNDRFGTSVAISSDGNTAIVGVPYGSNEKGAKTGSAYVYTRTNGTWSEQTKLLASDGAGGDFFGTSVSISSDGNTAIVGAKLDDNERGTDAGSAYIYTRTDGTWSEQTRLIANGGGANDWFGRTVSISSDGNTAIVGAYRDDQYRGSAYIYTRTDNTWIEQAKLLASDSAAYDNFGYSVSISSDGNTAIVGAYNNNISRGSIYVYTRTDSTWSEQAKLLASDGDAYDYFGISVSISSDGNTAIVGAYGDDNRRGSVYVYTRTDSTWIEQAKLLASDGAGNDYFGWSVTISSDGNTAIVGTVYDDNEKGTNAGSAYVYTRTDNIWTQKTKLLASDGASGDNFGYSVTISSDGNTAIVGVPYGSNERGNDAGSAYIFDLT